MLGPKVKLALIIKSFIRGVHSPKNVTNQLFLGNLRKANKAGKSIGRNVPESMRKVIKSLDKKITRKIIKG